MVLPKSLKEHPSIQAQSPKPFLDGPKTLVPEDCNFCHSQAWYILYFDKEAHASGKSANHETISIVPHEPRTNLAFDEQGKKGRDSEVSALSWDGIHWEIKFEMVVRLVEASYS